MKRDWSWRSWKINKHEYKPTYQNFWGNHTIYIDDDLFIDFFCNLGVSSRQIYGIV